MKLRLLAFAMVNMLVFFALFACVRKSDYDRDVNDLAIQLQRERAINAANVKDLEVKLKERAKALTELTDRYIALQGNAEALKAWKSGFDGELTQLARDVAELRLIVEKNAPSMKGPAPQALLGKVIDMEYRLEELRRKKKEGVPALQQ